jgi:hypothetical protein
MILFKIQAAHHNQEETEYPKEVDPKEPFHQINKAGLQHVKIIDHKKATHQQN